jgi:UDP-glucose 4-epimerase
LTPPFTEDMTPQPCDPYGIAKYAVELDLKAAHEMWGLNYIIFRPHNVYGEHQNLGDPYRNVIGIFMNQILRGEPLTVFGDGTQTRAFSYIDNVAPPIARSVQVPAAFGNAINIGADKPYSVNELAEVVVRAFGVSPNLKYLSERNEVVHAYTDHEVAKRLLGSNGTVPLADGIERMAAWARAAGARQSAGFNAVKVVRKLPPSWLAAEKWAAT